MNELIGLRQDLFGRKCLIPTGYNTRPFVYRKWRNNYFCYHCGATMDGNDQEEHTMEEFMYGQDMGNPEDGSL